jgi:plasmid stabilization system protein ParE
MPRSWSDKRERQYEHIKDSYEDEGVTEDKAEELAARTVNKQRAERGETKAPKKR